MLGFRRCASPRCDVQQPTRRNGRFLRQPCALRRVVSIGAPAPTRSAERAPGCCSSRTMPAMPIGGGRSFGRFERWRPAHDRAGRRSLCRLPHSRRSAIHDRPHIDGIGGRRRVLRRHPPARGGQFGGARAIQQKVAKHAEHQRRRADGRRRRRVRLRPLFRRGGQRLGRHDALAGAAETAPAAG